MTCMYNNQGFHSIWKFTIVSIYKYLNIVAYQSTYDIVNNVADNVADMRYC